VKIGVELSNIIEGETGELVPLLQGVLEALFAGWPELEVVLFGTPDNEGLFPTRPAQVSWLTLPRAASFFPLLDVHACNLRLDVLLCSYPFEAELAFPRARQIVVIPDCQHESFPDFFSPEALRGRCNSFARAREGAGAIATLSEHARQTVLNHSSARCRDVFLMSPALCSEWEHPSVEHLTEGERALLPRGDYFLFPANLWPHKNHRRLLRAFALFLQKVGRPVELVLTGHPQGWEELKRSIPNLPVRHLGFVRHDLVQVLVARARALTFFSLFEGFGMPLLEAFAVGTPVVCSNTSSLPEVGGEAVLTCDPTDPVAMSDAMLRVFTDEPLRARLAAAGRERLSLFSWHDSAARLVEACRRVHERAPALVHDPQATFQGLHRFVQDIEADRAAKQKTIEQLNAACAERLEAIQQLDAALRQFKVDLQESETSRAAQGKVIQRLEAALRESLLRKCLRVCQGFFKGKRKQAPRDHPGGKAEASQAPERGSAMIDRLVPPRKG
jgi:glycosyltransferase involved in cell wall biosynthesis